MGWLAQLFADGLFEIWERELLARSQGNPGRQVMNNPQIEIEHKAVPLRKTRTTKELDVS